MTTQMTRARNLYFRRVLTLVFDLDLRKAVRMTPRQEEVARVWLESGSYEEAGRRLGISGQAVMAHVQHLAGRAERVARQLYALSAEPPRAA